MTMDKAINALELLGFEVEYEMIEMGWCKVTAYKDGATLEWFFDDDEMLVSEGA